MILATERTISCMAGLSVVPCLVRKRNGAGTHYWSLLFHERYNENGRRRKRSLYLGSLSCLEQAAITELLRRAKTAMESFRVCIPSIADRKMRLKERQVRRAANLSVSLAVLGNFQQP
jgi:hypothetical protein